MKHILAILLITACAYSIVIRHANFKALRSASTRAHMAKAVEVTKELERSNAERKYIDMAKEGGDFILWQRMEWEHATKLYALLSNTLIILTIVYLGTPYIKMKKKNRT